MMPSLVCSLSLCAYVATSGLGHLSAQCADVVSSILSRKTVSVFPKGEISSQVHLIFETLRLDTRSRAASHQLARPAATTRSHLSLKEQVCHILKCVLGTVIFCHISTNLLHQQLPVRHLSCFGCTQVAQQAVSKKTFFISASMFSLYFWLGKTRLHAKFQIYRPINVSGKPI